MKNEPGQYYFVIVGHNDNIIFRLDYIEGQRAPEDDDRKLKEFIVHAALDMVDEKMLEATSNYLKVVDEYNRQKVSAYVTSSNMRFLLFHNTHFPDDSCKNFFLAAAELYIKWSLNPLYELNTAIIDKKFSNRIENLLQRYVPRTGH
ncbi:hypothetical protein SNEBB_006938 [Seison nebaliae]|nr:hypothetical protein SNEBB_006938 [Seison nebaliae]